MSTIQEQLRGKLIVSCQADPGNPLDDTEVIRRIARAVLDAGAEALRLNGAEQIAAIRRDTAVPIIGIQKRREGGILRITPDFASAQVLAEAGASIIALDCTSRSFPFGDPWQKLIQRIHRELKLPVMADIATFDEAVAAEEAGADFIGTTLNGYTEETRCNRSFSWQLLDRLSGKVRVPVIAEGRIWTPEEVRRALAEGAHCVVVGSAITRPGEITANFLRALRPPQASMRVLAADLGGTSIKAGIVDPEGKVTHTVQLPTEASRGRERIAANLASALERALEQAAADGIKPCGIGIASAGAMDGDEGSVFAATENLPGWAGFDLRSFAEKRFHLPAVVLNDAHAAALAELHYGQGRGLSGFIAITIGTGIGGGVVSNGHLLRGQLGFAGSVGHQTIRFDGRRCNCGRRGCLEAYVSTSALIEEYKQLGALCDPAWTDRMLAFEIGRLARAGDAAAQSAYMAMAGYLAEGVANLFNLFDPQAVLLSGGLVEGYPNLVAEVERRVTELVHFGTKRAPRILPATGGYYAGVQGAGALALTQLAR